MMKRLSSGAIRRQPSPYLADWGVRQVLQVTQNNLFTTTAGRPPPARTSPARSLPIFSSESTSKLCRRRPAGRALAPGPRLGPAAQQRADLLELTPVRASRYQATRPSWRLTGSSRMPPPEAFAVQRLDASARTSAERAARAAQSAAGPVANRPLQPPLRPRSGDPAVGLAAQRRVGARGSAARRGKASAGRPRLRASGSRAANQSPSPAR